MSPEGQEDLDYWNDKEWIVWDDDHDDENIVLDEELDDETLEGDNV